MSQIPEIRRVKNEVVQKTEKETRKSSRTLKKGLFTDLDKKQRPIYTK